LEELAAAVFRVAMSEWNGLCSIRARALIEVVTVLVCIRVVVSSNLGKDIDSPDALIRPQPLLLKLYLSHSAIRRYNVRY
jgi:hypothetical protein